MSSAVDGARLKLQVSKAFSFTAVPCRCPLLNDSKGSVRCDRLKVADANHTTGNCDRLDLGLDLNAGVLRRWPVRVQDKPILVGRPYDASAPRPTEERAGLILAEKVTGLPVVGLALTGTRPSSSSPSASPKPEWCGSRHCMAFRQSCLSKRPVR